MTLLSDIAHGRQQRKSKPPVWLRYRSSKTFILATVSIAVFTDIFLYGLIVPVLPFALSERASIPESRVQHWISVLLAVYGAALLAGSPIFGWFADRSQSRRLPLLIGLLALAGSTIILCLGTTIGALVAGRLLQGLSAAIVWTVGLALLVDTVGQADIGQAIGYVTLAMSLGMLVAPLLGGVVYDRGGYYAVFAMAFGLIALDIFLRLVLIEKKIAAKWTKEDAQPTNNTTSLRDGQSQHASSDAQESTAVKHDAGSPLASGTGPHPKRRTRLPPVVTLLKSRRLLAALWGCFTQATLLASFDSVLPLFVKRVLGWGSTGAGLIFLALIVPSFSAPAVGWLSDRYGPRWPATVGFIFGLPFLVLLRTVTGDTVAQAVLLAALLVLIGIALTLVMPPLMAEMTYVVEAKEKKQPGIFGKQGAYAQAYGLFTTAFAGGTLVGPLWAGFIEARAGWNTMSWTLGLLCGLTAIPTIIFTGGYIGRTNAKRARDRAAPGVERKESAV